MLRPESIVLVAVLATSAGAQERPTMRQLPAAAGLPRPPSPRELVDARASLKARFGEELSHTETAGGARAAATVLLDAAVAETSPAIKWLMLDEARRLGAAAGNAEIVTRAITLTSAVFDVDELAIALESLEGIPLRALDPGRASRVAEAAEQIATRADIDGRSELASAGRNLAYKAWQRAGNTAAARRVAERGSR